MSGPTVIRAADHRVMRWKNGGGTTAEIAVSPQGSGLDDFDWRLSMATVETDGPFSAFPGIDRTLSILEGEGIRLRVGRDEPVELTTSSAPHFFAADASASADLVSGPVLDLNVMSRRGRVAHAVRRLHLVETLDIAPHGHDVAIFCAEGRLQVDLGDGPTNLTRHDTAIWSNDRTEARLRPDPFALVYTVEIRRA
ncbi:HutD family protein [Mesorhizobium sp. LHD-90]|uniref:HutD/Ves family protein n=1 Tax=Mesorhizobium sp. LHD-90 TaxID=3071414 RepID=UPI0027E16A03|nr:HutD family protein [Mesorhizobium sp. LHD-90]MDQ6435010.1 HutD family protein [Mesorhizobium sp. LHD-90]